MSTVRKGTRHAMRSECSPTRKKRKVNEEEEVVNTKDEDNDDEVNTKDKEEKGSAREYSAVAFAPAVSPQAAAAGHSLLPGRAPYNSYVDSQRKCSYRIRLYVPSSHIFPMLPFRPRCFSSHSFALPLVVAEPGGIFTKYHVGSTATR
jgi:hypothetical protein